MDFDAEPCLDSASSADVATVKLRMGDEPESDKELVDVSVLSSDVTQLDLLRMTELVVMTQTARGQMRLRPMAHLLPRPWTHRPHS